MLRSPVPTPMKPVQFRLLLCRLTDSSNHGELESFYFLPASRWTDSPLQTYNWSLQLRMACLVQFFSSSHTACSAADQGRRPMCALGVVAVCNGLLAMIPFKLPKMNMMKAKRSTMTTGGLIENELRLRGRHVA